nr:MAG: RNA-dependent RNA polymerase [Army ant associated Nodavirus 1]
MFSKKSLSLGLGAIAAGAAAYQCYRCVRQWAVIGPYTPADGNCITRTIQRMVIDKTRAELDGQWFVGNSFTELEPRRVSDNGHPKCGAVRDAARRLIESAVTALGADRLEISPGGHSTEETYADHQHYAVGDLHRATADDSSEGKGDVVVGIDVDYYLTEDRINHYFSLGKPTIWHTFNPTTVAGTDGDAKFRISKNLVKYEVSGGGCWEHQIWNWCAFGEFVEASCVQTWVQWGLRKLGLEKVVYHKVHHARPWKDCPHRVLVWTVPVFSCWKLRGLPSDLRARRLQRVEYQCHHRPGWNTIVALQDGELWMNLGREGEDATVSVKKEHYDVLMGLKAPMSLTTRMINMKYTAAEQLALMGQYFSGDPNAVPEATRLARSSVFVHWPYSSDAEQPETSSRCYASPLVTNPNLMPMVKRWETLSRSLERRVTFVKNNKVPCKQMLKYATEFVRLVVPNPHEGVPYTPEEARIELNKPSQTIAVRQVWETLDAPARQLIESFVKNEPTMKNGRIISSFPDARFLVMFSRFTLACRDQILHAEHNKHWFCPGLTPEEISAKVCEYCQKIRQPVEGDYDNFDGSVSSWCQRHVMNAIYLRWVGREYRKDLGYFLDMLISCPARAKLFGFRYEAGVGVKSGSPTTCDLNTCLNAFLMYCAVRQTNAMLTPEEAFREIGLAFGDDSVHDIQYKNAMEKVVHQVGMKIKMEVCKPETGVTFLARVFVDPWATRTSMQDPVRTMRKAHMTSRDTNVPIADAAMDRTEGQLVTDGETPVLSNFAKMVQRVYKNDVKDHEKRMARKDRLKEKPYWLTTGGAWPQDPEDRHLMLEVMSARTGIEVAELLQMENHLDQLNDPWSVSAMDVDKEEPYKDCVKPDGTPADAEVDARNVQSERDVNHQRAVRGGDEVVGPRSPALDGCADPALRVGGSPGEGGARFGEFQSVRRGAHRGRGAGGRSAPNQAEFQRLAGSGDHQAQGATVHRPLRGRPAPGRTQAQGRRGTPPIRFGRGRGRGRGAN